MGMKHAFLLAVAVGSFCALLPSALCQEEDPTYVSPLENVADCRTGSGDTFHQYYDVAQLACRNCQQNSTYQTATEDGE